MPFITANPNEYLVIGRRGRITNLGLAARTFLWPGTPHILLPSTQQEATFEMTQETRDGIPLRFKGIVVYRVVAPEITVQLFDFASGDGHEAICTLLSHMCLGELRAQVAQMTMGECIEQRKTTLTDAVSVALQGVVSEGGEGRGWGISLDLVQVAQVFIVDQELRRQLEAEVRNQIRGQSDLSDLRMREELKHAQAASERRLEREKLESEREQVAIERAKRQLEIEAEREELETHTPLRLEQIARRHEVVQAEIALAQAQNSLRALEVEQEMMSVRAQQDLRKEILPLENMPLIADAASRVWQGAHLSIYGEAAPLVSTLGPLMDVLAHGLRAGEAEQDAD